MIRTSGQLGHHACEADVGKHDSSGLARLVRESKPVVRSLSRWHGELAWQGSERVSYLVSQVTFGSPLRWQGRYVGLSAGFPPGTTARPGAAAIQHRAKRRRAFTSARCQCFSVDYWPGLKIFELFNACEGF